MNAKEILELAQHLDSEFGAQQKEDDRIAQLLQRKAGVQSGQKYDPNDPVKRIGTGHPGLAINQSYSLLTNDPFLRINSPKDSQDKQAERVENGTQGLWIRSGAKPAWLKSTFDFVWSGRGILKVCYYPQMWKDYKPGEYDTEEEVKADKEKMMRLKEGNCPIITRYIDPRNCRRTTTITGDTDVVTERLKLPVRAAKAAYPTVNFKEMKPEEMVEIVHYADWQKLQTIVLVSGQPQETEYDFDHNLGMNPYVYIVAPPTAPSDDLEFRGGLYHTKDLFDAEEALFSSAMYNILKQVRAAYKIERDLGFVDEGVDEGIAPAGEKRQIKLEPGGIVDNLQPGEHFGAIEAARSNIDVFPLLDRFGVLINSTAIQPVLQGILRSGVSGTGYNTTAQLAKEQYGPATSELQAGAVAVGTRLLRCVEEFGEEIPLYFTKASGETFSLILKPAEVQGWGHRLQAIIDLAVPINENAEIEKWKLAVDPTNPLVAWETGASRWGNIENPVEEWERIQKNQIARAMLTQIIQLVNTNFYGQLANPSPGFEQELAQLPQAAQRAIAIYASNQASGGQLARTNANTVRENVPQNPTQNGY